MNNMKTIKIFLASSEELADDRKEFGNLIRRLDDIYQRRGIHIKLIMWEDLDMTFKDRRKQDEYNDVIRGCHVFIALFYKLAGQYTREELEVANRERRIKNAPHIIIYCRDLKDGEVESEQLADFKHHLETELGHFWGHYSTGDKLHLDFVMWLQRTELDGESEIKVKNGEVTFEGTPIATVSKLPFAASNTGYQQLKEKIETIQNEIQSIRQAIEQCPGAQMLKDMLQKKLDEYNQLKIDFEQYQQSLIDTARRISKMQLEKISVNLRRAIEAFENGDVNRANVLLDEIANEAELHIVQLEQQRHLVHQDIKAFQLQAKTVLVDSTLLISDRISKTLAIYAKADKWAVKSALPNDAFNSLLADYGSFLVDYAYYEEAKSIYSRLVDSLEKEFGSEHPLTATSYNNLGVAFYQKGEYYKALEYFLKASAIREKVLGYEHPDTANTIHRIGAVYYCLGDYLKALEYSNNALEIRKKVLGEDHPDTADSYNNIGNIRYRQKRYEEALDSYLKSLLIRIRVLGLKSHITAKSYNDIGMVYNDMHDYIKALTYYPMALQISERELGEQHPDTASVYNNIGNVYANQGSYRKALESYSEAALIFEKTLGLNHPNTAISYNNIGFVHAKLNDNEKAKEYYSKALHVFTSVFGENHQLTITVKDNLEIIQNKLKLSIIM